MGWRGEPGNLAMQLLICVCLLCGQDTVFEEPLRVLSEAQVEDMGLKYYNSDVHRATFVLPQFAKKVRCINSVEETHKNT